MKAIEIKCYTLEMNIFDFYSQAHTFIKMSSIGKKGNETKLPENKWYSFFNLRKELFHFIIE